MGAHLHALCVIFTLLFPCRGLTAENLQETANYQLYGKKPIPN